MDFLNKIKRHIQGRGDKEFRKQVLEEKKQKYLFSDDITDKYRSSRSGFFREKKRAIAPFTNQFTESITHLKKRFDESHLWAYIGLLLIILSLYIILFSPYFRLSPSHVLLEAKNEWIDISVGYRAVEDIYGTSLFLLDEEEVGMILKKSLKNLAHVTIDKLYPNWLKVIMTSTPIIYDARIYGLTKEWRMSGNGVLIPKSPGTWSGGVELMPFETISESLRGEVFFDYKQIIEDEQMLIIGKIIELFETEWKDLPIIKTRYFARENELHFTLKSGTHILFTLEPDNNNREYFQRINTIKNQLKWLKTYIEKNKNSLLDGSIYYIDARIVKKIFICKDRAICQNNLLKVYGETYK